MFAIETIADLSFLLNIILTFFSAFEKHGHMEVRPKQIALTYLKSWFLLDLIAAFPYQFLEAGIPVDENDLVLSRIRHLPTAYRAVRVLGYLKLLRFCKTQNSERFLQETLNVGIATSNIISLAVLVLFLTHITACAWFMQAKWLDFEPDCWVIQEEFLDKEPSF